MTWVSPYWREPASKTKQRQEAMTEMLRNEYFAFVGNVLAMELERELDVLDGLDMHDDWKQMQREIW